MINDEEMGWGILLRGNVDEHGGGAVTIKL